MNEGQALISFPLFSSIFFGLQFSYDYAADEDCNRDNRVGARGDTLRSPMVGVDADGDAKEMKC